MPSILVLGTGQLGLMLAAAGARLGIQVDRLDVDTHITDSTHESTHAPIADLIPGTSSTRVPIQHVSELTHYQYITAEKEQLPNTSLIQKLQSWPAWVHTTAFQELPNRARQKHLLDTLKIATSPWKLIQSEQDLQQAQSDLGDRLVVKTTEGGYDGNGQWRLPQDTGQIPDTLYGQLIAEQWISFTEEVSIIGARSADGQCQFLPLSHNVHDKGILRYSVSGHTPPHPLQSTAEQWLARLMEATDHQGVMAMECFITADQQLMVNEIAPRVHNSGHWSQTGAKWSQFDWHLAHLLGLPLAADNPAQPTLMLNLIGCHFNADWACLPGIDCHWYGKSHRVGRKLGHLNILLNADWNTQTSALLPLLDQEHQKHLNAAMVALMRNESRF